MRHDLVSWGAEDAGYWFNLHDLEGNKEKFKSPDVVVGIKVGLDRINQTDGNGAGEEFLIPSTFWTKNPAAEQEVGMLRSASPYHELTETTACIGCFVNLRSILEAATPSPACRINLESVAFAAAAESTAMHMSSTWFMEYEGNPGMYLRYASEEVEEPTITNDTITGRIGDTIIIQGVTADGKNWSYSKRLGAFRPDATEVTLSEVYEAGWKSDVFASETELTSFAGVKVWAEKLGTGDQEGLLLTSAIPETPTPNEPGNGQTKPNKPGNGVTSPPTGDNLQTWLWLGVLTIGVIAVGGGCICGAYRRKERFNA